jgi:hypothetical protein
MLNLRVWLGKLNTKLFCIYAIHAASGDEDMNPLFMHNCIYCNNCTIYTFVYICVVLFLYVSATFREVIDNMYIYTYTRIYTYIYVAAWNMANFKLFICIQMVNISVLGPESKAFVVFVWLSRQRRE